MLAAIDWSFIFEQSLNEALDINAVVYALAAIGLNPASMAAV